MHVKQVNIRPKKHRSCKGGEENHGVAKSTVWYIPETKDRAAELQSSMKTWKKTEDNWSVQEKSL